MRYFNVLLNWFTIICCSTLAFSQNASIDSLKKLITTYDVNKASKFYTLKDSVKVKLYEVLSDETYQSHPEESIEYNRKALKIANKIHFNKGILYNNYILGMYYSASGDYLISLNHLNKADSIAKKSKNEYRIANIASEKGILYARMSNYSEALKHSLISLRYYEKTGNKHYYANGLVNIGILYKHQNKIDEALNYYRKAIAIYSKLKVEGATYSTAGAYSNMGQAYMKAGKVEQAIEALQKSQSIAAKLNNAYVNAENTHGLALAYSTKNEFEKSIFYYQKALVSYESIKDQAGISKSRINLGYTYFKNNEFEKAFENNLKGIELAKSIKNLEWQKEGYEHRAEMFANQNNFKEAYFNQVLFKAINDSIFNVSQEKKITELQMQYAFDKTQQKSKTIQRQKIVNLNQEKDKLRFLRNGALVISVILLVLFGIIFYNFHKGKKQRKLIDLQKSELELKNKRIQNALSEKEVLLKEIHHRVKNNLQIISSLLNIQTQNITDEKILDTIKEGQSRVQAMSLIHQNLYQSEELDSINIENYLRELGAYLRSVFTGTSKNITISVEAPELYFDIDTAIPLGLIVNELVSNSFKYAFKNKDEGAITISIEFIDEANYQLIVSDNGNGFGTDFKLENNSTLGLKLVTILSRQLRGSVHYEIDNGARFCIKFKDLKVYNSLKRS